MYYTNSMKVTLKNTEAATKALEVLRTRLIAGFDCDKGYARIPSMMMLANLEVADNTIVLPEDFGCYTPNDSMSVIPELMKDLAAHLSGEDFSFYCCNTSDYDESWVKGSYAEGELNVATTYLPSGDCYLYCPECDELITTLDEYEEGKTYTCPECGEEIDLSDWAPITTEKTYKII